MGFKVNLKEVNNNLTALTKSVKQLDTRLDASKNALNKIVTSNSIYGATGKAITNDINNNQAATLVGFEDMTTELIQEYEDLIQEFQSTVGETDSSAVMNEDALNKFKQDLTSLLTDRSAIDNTFQQAYNLANGTGQVSLSMPKSSFNSDVNDVTKDVSDVISKVQAFNSRKVTSQSEALLDKLTKQIHSFAGYGSTSFSNAKLQTFMATGSFASEVESANKELNTDEEVQDLLSQWETEYPISNWNKMTLAQKLQYAALFSQYLLEFGIKLNKKALLASIGKVGDPYGNPGKQDVRVTKSMADDDSLTAGEINQQQIGDCWFLSQVNAMMETKAGRQDLRNGVKWDSSKNAYKVRVYKNGKPVWVVVSNVYVDGATIGGGQRGIVSLYEAAIGQEFGRGYLKSGAGSNAISITENAKSSDEVTHKSTYLNWNFPFVHTTTTYISSEAVASKGSTDGTSSLAGTPSDYGSKEDPEFKLETGDSGLKVSATSDPGSGITKKVDIVGGHEYEVVNIKDGMIGLRNPWGIGNIADYNAQNPQGVFYISKADFDRAFDIETVEK